jgi:hypothetical protein
MTSHLEKLLADKHRNGITSVTLHELEAAMREQAHERLKLELQNHSSVVVESMSALAENVQEPAHHGKKVVGSAENAVIRQQAKECECPICLMLVKSPQVACSECDQLFCESCIALNPERRRCPCCRKSCKFLELTRTTKNMLEETRYRCDFCPETFSYAEQAKHSK